MAENTNTCTVSGCNRKHLARGLCSGHYQRRLRGSQLTDDAPIRTRNEGACSVDGCQRPARTKMMCAAHYARMLTTGDARPTEPVSRVRRNALAIDRVLEDAVQTDSGCLEIPPTLRNPAGYGNISVRGRTRLAHRIVWEYHYGSIPDGLVVRHRCDNPPCVCIDHLELGTQGDNVRDSYQRNRR